MSEKSGPSRFLRNDRYFTICVYTFILVVCCTIAIKAIISFDQTRKFLFEVGRAVGPFLIAILIAYVLAPFVRRVNRLIRKIFKRLPEKPAMVISMFIVYLIALGCIIALLVYVLPEVVRNLMDLISKIPEGYQQLIRFVESMQDRFPQLDLSSVTSMLESTQGDLISSLTNASGEIIPVLYTASVSVVQWFVNFVIAIVVSIYMLYGKKALKRLCRVAIYAFVPT